MKRQYNLLSAFVFFSRYLFSKRANAVIRRVSLICCLGLTVSLASLLIVFNVMGGLGGAIKDQFLKTTPHLTIFLEKKPVSFQRERIIQLLKSQGLGEGVHSLNFFESGDVLVRTQAGLFSGAIAKSLNKGNRKFLDPATAFAMEGDILDKNQIPAFAGMTANMEGDILDKNLSPRTKKSQQNQFNKIHPLKQKPGLVISWSLAEELDLYEGERIDLIPAENLLLTPTESASFESGYISSIISFQNSSSHYVFYDPKKMTSFSEKSSYQFGFELRLKDPEAFLLYKKVLQKLGLRVETWAEQNSALFFALRMEKAIMSAFLSLAGFITLLSLASLLVLLMVQKKKERGILMAMGLTKIKIKHLFLKVGLLMTGAGLLGSAFLSVLVCLILKYVPLPFLSAFYEEGALFPIEFHFGFMFLLFLLVLILSFVVCVLSIRSQNFFSPSELLKTETN